MSPHPSDQAAFWAGEFGTNYIGRNSGSEEVALKIALLGRALTRAVRISSAIEFGANVGNNLVALGHHYPGCKFTGIEVNPDAAKLLAEVPNVVAINSAIEDTSPVKLGRHDLAFSVTVLIHIAPENLRAVYDRLYECSSRYVLIAEYYNPTPVEIPYRGHARKLFKRDFAGELMGLHPDLKLIDYGFCYHGDPACVGRPTYFDDITWFLMERPSHPSDNPA